VIDRAGQTWEFNDGTIVLVLASRALLWESDDRVSISHDVLILRSTDEGYPDDFCAGSFSADWREGPGKTWDERNHSQRWRIA